MALNLKTLAVRSISAAVFVVLLLGSVIWSYYSFVLFFFVVAMIALHEFYNLSQKLGAQPFKVIGFSLSIILFILSLNFDLLQLVNIKPALFVKPFLIVIPFIILTVALFKTGEKPIQNALFTLLGIMYAVLPFALLNFIVKFYSCETDQANFSPHYLIAVILLIWSNDTFAYLGGSLFGKHKLIERISPGKTWEGTIFGILVSFGFSFLVRDYFIMEEPAWRWPIIGLLVPILATIGDLIESMLKRQAGIKDSGNIMPGHGGILDRFDSLIFVSPFVFVVFKYL